MNKRTAIVIPVYNEAEVIKGVINSLLKHFKYVVCVNDGSNDSSSNEIGKTKAYLINHPMNMGQGAALQTAIEFARLLPVDYFVTFDADGQHDVADAMNMLNELENSKYDIILGSRFLGQATGINRLKIGMLKLAIKFSNLETGLKLTDTHNGLRAFNRHVADIMHITLPDMAHASEILGIIAKNKFRYKEVPVTINYTEYSKRKGQSITNSVNIAFDVVLRKLNKK
jgi:glycosyltransferase involved in cell wall biosynthesis